MSEFEIQEQETHVCELCLKRNQETVEVSWRDGTIMLCPVCEKKTRRKLERGLD